MSNIEHRELTQAIISYNRKTANSVELQKQLWSIWRYNEKVCVPTYPNERPPYDWAMMTTNAGNVYVFYTETRLICQGDRPYIIHVPFKELLNRIYNSNGLVNGILMNPTINNQPAEYTIGFNEDFLRQLCKGDMLVW